MVPHKNFFVPLYTAFYFLTFLNGARVQYPGCPPFVTLLWEIVNYEMRYFIGHSLTGKEHGLKSRFRLELTRELSVREFGSRCENILKSYPKNRAVDHKKLKMYNSFLFWESQKESDEIS